MMAVGLFLTRVQILAMTFGLLTKVMGSCAPPALPPPKAPPKPPPGSMLERETPSSTSSDGLPVSTHPN